MSGGEIVGLAAVICIFGGPILVGIVYAVVHGWSNVAKHREDVDLKHKLVEAGFSVDAIERVLNAGRDVTGKGKQHNTPPPETQLRVG